MNFIIEVLPKNENRSVYVYVVRSSNGFPLSVCDSLEDAKDIIAEQIIEFEKVNSKKATK